MVQIISVILRKSAFLQVLELAYLMLHIHYKNLEHIQDLRAVLQYINRIYIWLLNYLNYLC